MRSILFTLMTLFLLTACAAQPAAPTATITPPSPTFTLVPTETPTLFPTPTESKLPESELRNLQERLGKEFTLVETTEKDTEGNFIYLIVDEDKQPVPDIKVFKDGSSESVIEFNEEQFTAVVPLQTISLDNNKNLLWSGWRIENGEKITITSPAFKEASEASSAAQLAIIENHPKEKQMTDTIRLHTRMALGDPYTEFRNIKVGDKILSEKDIEPAELSVIDFRESGADITYSAILIDGFEPRRHQSDYYYQIPQARPSKLGLSGGFSHVTIYRKNGEVKVDAISMPVVILDTDGKVKIGTALIQTNKYDSITRNLDTNNVWRINTVVMTKYIHEANIKYNKSDFELGKFMADRNEKYIVKSPYANLNDFANNILGLDPLLMDNVLWDINIVMITR